MAIKNTATIEIRLNVLNNRDFATFKRNLTGLVDSFKGLGRLDAVAGLVADLHAAQSQITALTSNLKSLDAAEDKVTASTEEAAAASKELTAFYRAQELQTETMIKASIAGDKAKEAAAKAAIRAAQQKKKAEDAYVKAIDQERQAQYKASAAQRSDILLKKQLIERIDEASKKSKEFARNTQGLASAIQEAALGTGQLKAYATQVAAAEKSLDKHTASMKTSLGYRASYFERQMDALFRMSFRMQMAGYSLIQFGRSIKNFLDGIMDTFGEFQFNLFRAAGALSIFDDATGVTNPLVMALQESVIGLSEKMLLMPIADVAKAMYYWGSTVGSVVDSTAALAQQMSAIAPIMQAALMTQMSYEQVIKGVYSIVSQYYNGAIEEAANVTEKLYYITQITAAEFGDLVNSFKMVGPVARANNVTFEDMVSLLGRLADLGVRGTMAGRAFRQMFIQLVRPSGPALSAIKQLFQQTKAFGGQTYESLVFPSGSFVGVNRYIEILAKATMITEDFREADRARFLSQIATANEIPVLTALILDQQRAYLGLNKNVKDYAATSKTAHEYFIQAWTRLQNSWTGVIGGLQRTWESLQVTVGSALADTLEPLIIRVREVIESIRIWARDNEELVGSIGKYLAIVAALSAVAGTALIVAGAIATLVQITLVVTRTLSPFLGIIAGAVIGLLSLGEAVVRNAEYLKSQFSEALRIVQEEFSSSTDTAQSFMDIIDAMLKPLRDLSDMIVRGFADLTVHLADLVKVLRDFNGMTGGGAFQAVMTFIGTLIAAQTISGIVSLTARLLGLRKVMALLAAPVLLDATTGAMSKGGGLFQVFNAFNVAKSAAAAKGIGTVRASIMGVTGAVKGLASALGPGGIFVLILGLGFAAYATDFLGFKDFIDGITNSFRNLKDEIQQVVDYFGEIGPSLSKTTRQMARESLLVRTDVGKAGTILGEATHTFAPEPFQLPESDQWRFWLEGSLSQPFETLDAAIREQDRLVDERAADLLQTWKRSAENMTIKLGRAVSPEEYGKVLQTLQPILSGDELTRAIEVVLRDAPIGSSEHAFELVAKNIESWDVPAGIVNAIMSLFSPDALSKAVDETARQANTAEYKPIFDKLHKLYDLHTEESMAEIAKILSESVNTISYPGINNIIKLNGVMLARNLAGFNTEEDSFIALLLEKLPGLLYPEDETPAIERIATELAGSLEYFITSTFESTLSKVEPIYDDIINSVYGGEFDKAVQTIFAKIAVNKEAWAMVPDQLRSGLESIIEEAVTQGFVLTPEMQAILGEQADTVGGDVASEMIDAFVEGFTRRSSLKGSIKEALSRGQDKFGIAKMFMGWFKGIFGKAAFTTTNMAAHNIWLEGVLAQMEGYANAWKLKGPKGKGFVEKSWKNFLMTIPWKKLSPETRTALHAGAKAVNTTFAGGITQNQQRILEAYSKITGLSVQQLSGIATKAGIWGMNITNNLANGIESDVAQNNVTGALLTIAGLVADYWGFNSPAPKMGPLSDLPTWGIVGGQEYAKNLIKGFKSSRSMVESELGLTSDISVDRTRKVHVQIDVKDQNGSLNRASLQELRKAAMDAFSVAGLEHVVTVG